LTVVFLLGTVAVIAVNLATRSRGTADIGVVSEDLSPEKIEKQEQIEHVETEGEREHVQVKADEHLIGDEDISTLKGNVEVIFPKKRQGKDVYLYGDEVVYSKDFSRFFSRGDGKVVCEDLKVESSSLEYDRETEVFRSEKGIRFETERLSGFAQKMVYSVESDAVELWEDIQIRLTSSVDPSRPIEISGNRFRYSRLRKKGIMEGDVRISQEGSEASARIAQFDMYKKSEEIRQVFLIGEAKARLIQGGKEKTQRSIQAERMKIRSNESWPNFQTIETRGGGGFESSSTSGSKTRIGARFLRFVFNREDELSEFRAEGNAWMEETGQQSEDQRLIRGNSLFLRARIQVLEIKGDDRQKAAVQLDDRVITADQMIVELDENNIQAEGSAKVVFRSPEGKKQTVGFFSEQQAVFMTSSELRYIDGDKRFYFKGDVKVWQEKRMLSAEKMTLETEKGSIDCDGGVKAIIPYKPRDGEEERVEIAAGSMKFLPESQVLIFSDKGALRVKNINLRSQSLSVQLGEGAVEMKTIKAAGKVVIIQGQNEGRGDEADYDVQNELIVLTGNPVFTDKDKGQTGGDKLTFSIADGKIIVENKGRDRSVTVIK